MDNILIYTSGLLQNYKAKTHMVLKKLWEIKLILNINKYQLEKNKWNTLGLLLRRAWGYK